MDWLSQNWLWVALAVAAAFYFFRGGLSGHAAGHGGMVGMGHGGHAGGHGDQDEAPGMHSGAAAVEAAVDPVSGEAVRTVNAPASIYEGKIYYFASRENRDQFEAAPQEHAHKVQGTPVATASEPRPRRHHGCC